MGFSQINLPPSFFQINGTINDHSSGNKGVKTCSLIFKGKKTLLFHMENEVSMNMYVFHRLWDGYRIIGLKSEKIDALVVQLVLLCVQWTFSILNNE